MKAYMLTFETPDWINGFGQVVSWKSHEYEFLAPSIDAANEVAGIVVFRRMSRRFSSSQFGDVVLKEIRALSGERELFELPQCFVFKSE